jgi:anthranilate phosphoribosyltransferase
MDLKTALGRLIERRDLGADDMAAVVGTIMDGQATAAQVGSLLTALRMKGETVGEVVGAAQAMRARMVRPDLPPGPYIDMCGTGGDGSGSVNISTIAAFVVAGCGVKVAKHGNRAMSSRAGSHDLLEELGLDPAAGPELAVRCLTEAHLCFFFAPAYHAATKHVIGPRREVGFRTMFNLLGPLTNPAGARFHVNGVFAAERCEFMARAHHQLGSERALVLHGTGGLDEMAPAGVTLVAELRDGEVRRHEVRPADFGLDEADPAGLQGGEPADNARLALAAMSGAPGAIRVAVLMTAAAALYVTGNVSDLRSGAARAALALDAGKALAVLDRLRRLAPRPIP